MTNFQSIDGFWFELDKKDRIVAELREEILKKDREIERLERVLKILESIHQEHLSGAKLSRESIIATRPKP